MNQFDDKYKIINSIMEKHGILEFKAYVYFWNNKNIDVEQLIY